MKRCVIVYIISFLSFSSFSQIEINPVISLSATNSSYVLGSAFKTDYIFQSFVGINTKLGVEFSKKKGSFYVLGNYQYSGSYFSDSFFDYLIAGKLFKNRSHFLGGEIEYQFYNNGKRFRPFISLMLANEVSTNSKYSYLSESFGFRSSPMSYETIISSGYPPETTYFSYFYMATPFIGSLTGGFVFQVNNNFNIKLGAGYGLRKMKTKYAQWKEDEDINSILNESSVRINYFHMLDVQLGVSYTIQLKKNKKE